MKVSKLEPARVHTGPSRARVPLSLSLAGSRTVARRQRGDAHSASSPDCRPQHCCSARPLTRPTSRLAGRLSSETACVSRLTMCGHIFRQYWLPREQDSRSLGDGGHCAGQVAASLQANRPATTRVADSLARTARIVAIIIRVAAPTCCSLSTKPACRRHKLWEMAILHLGAVFNCCRCATEQQRFSIRRRGEFISHVGGSGGYR